MRKPKEVKRIIDKKRKEEPKVIEALRCPFCGDEFKVKDLVFAISTDSAAVEVDHIYKDFMEEQFLPTGKNLDRRLLFMNEWNETNVLKRDIGGVPLIVEGEFFAPEKKGLASFDLGFDDPLDDSTSFGLTEPSHTAAPKKRSLKTKSVYRLCPYCHCELPDGLGSYQEITIGMYGGKRSGKTTYMSIAAMYMCNHMGSMGLGDTSVIEESRIVLDNLYKASVSFQGAAPTLKGKRCFPIGLNVNPSQKEYAPFFLFFQDIPGEAAVVGDDTLVHHPFTRANAFLGIVDINMFVRTKEQENMNILDSSIKGLADKETLLGLDFTDEKKRKELTDEKERLGLSICTMKYHEVFGSPKFAKHMNQLRSVQLVLTKIDRWKSAAVEEQKELAYCSELLNDHTRQHEYAIDELHLKYVDKQIRSIIRLFPEADIATPDGKITMLEWLVDNLGGNSQTYHQAYTGVSSVPGVRKGIAAIAQSDNILDPILNICRWENLLPVKQK